VGRKMKKNGATKKKIQERRQRGTKRERKKKKKRRTQTIYQSAKKIQGGGGETNIPREGEKGEWGRSRLQPQGGTGGKLGARMWLETLERKK